MYVSVQVIFCDEFESSLN